MNKAEYLAELEKRLAALGAEERAELLADYEAHFEHGRAAGRTDEEIARRLGPPQAVARDILYQLSVDRAQADPTLRRVSRAVFAGVGLGIVNVLVLLLPFLIGVLVTAALFAAALFLVASPLLGLIQDGPTTDYLLELPLYAGLAGAGLILWVAAVKFASWFVRWMLARLQRNVKTGKEDHA
jgi:uncharacterized membrane protein